MTTAFYIAPEHFRGDRVVFPSDEARHAAGALRKEAGDVLVVVDGEGGWFEVQLDQVSKKNVVGTVKKRRREVGEPAYNLTIGLGILKQRSRYETFLEKAVELGVRRIVPIITQRTEKTGFREKRARRIMVAALKQSGRSRLPELATPCSLTEYWDDYSTSRHILCHEAAHDESLKQALRPWKTSEPLSIAIGPEGGFTREEVEDARKRGAHVAHLGARRLRAETAGIFAASVVMYESFGTPAP